MSLVRQIAMRKEIGRGCPTALQLTDSVEPNMNAHKHNPRLLSFNSRRFDGLTDFGMERILTAPSANNAQPGDQWDSLLNVDFYALDSNIPTSEGNGIGCRSHVGRSSP